MKRDIEFKQMQVSEKAHTYLYSQKRGSAEQLSAVLDRILGEYRNSELGQLQDLYREQVRCTQSWMARCYEAQEKLKARNQVLDDVIYERDTMLDESKDFDSDESEQDESLTDHGKGYKRQKTLDQEMS